MSLTLASRITLNDGAKMPVLGLGTAGARGKACRDAVRVALELGYRLIDTASSYGNEREVGAALQESGVPREDVFVTTKVWNTEQGYESTIRACESSLQRLGLNHVDLYLIHWPVEKKRLDTWRALVHLRDQGRCRSIGVSNFMVSHLEELRASNNVVPAVNQIEVSPYLYPAEVIDTCRQRWMAVEAYSPLARGHRMRDPAIAAIGARHQRTSAQVMIRWSLQHGLVPIPKSVHPERIRENATVFDFSLSDADMRTLDRLNTGLHFDWDPTNAP